MTRAAAIAASRAVRGARWIKLAAVAALGLAGPAFAQTSQPFGQAQGGLPGISTGSALSTLPTVDRDRPDRTIPNLPRMPQLPPSLPRPSARVANNVAVVANLTAVRWEGSTLPQAALDAGIARFVGHALSTETLQAIAAAVTRTYADRDIAFYAVIIPPQVPTGGILTVRIVEGRVTQYLLNGQFNAKATPRIAAQIRKILADKPLHKSTLERALSLMRDLPSQKVDAQMRQIGADGALLLELTTRRKSINIALTLNNDGIANVTTAFQAQVAVSFNNVLRDGDRTQVSSFLPFNADRYQFYSASHTTPIGDNGLSLGLNGAYLRTRSLDQKIVGTAKLAGVTLAYPIVRSYKTNVTASLSLDGVDSSNYFLDTRFGDYRSRALRAGLSYARSDDKNGLALSIVVSRGLDGLGAKAFTGFSDAQFTKVNLQGVVVRALSKTIAVKLTSRAQYSNDKLPVTERATIGGPGAGRAFQVGAVTGEKAAAGMLEIDWTPPIKSPLFKGSGLFGFVDAATARTVARPFYGLPAEHYSLASAGGGVRVALGGKWHASVEVAVPIRRPTPFYTRKAQAFFGFGRSF